MPAYKEPNTRKDETTVKSPDAVHHGHRRISDLFYDGLGNKRVLEDMLSEAFVEQDPLLHLSCMLLDVFDHAFFAHGTDKGWCRQELLWCCAAHVSQPGVVWYEGVNSLLWPQMPRTRSTINPRATLSGNQQRRKRRVQDTS